MESSENQNGQSQNQSDSDLDENAGFSSWRSQENDNENDSSHSNSTNKREGTRTTSTSTDDSDLDFIQDRFQQIEVTPGLLQESTEMKDQATDVFDLKYCDRPRKKIKACQLESRMRRMSFRKRKAYKKSMRCCTEVAPAYQSLYPNHKPVPPKNETPKSNLRKRKRKLRRCSEKPFTESCEESSEEMSSP